MFFDLMHPEKLLGRSYVLRLPLIGTLSKRKKKSAAHENFWSIDEAKVD